MWPLDLWPWAHCPFVPKKSPDRAKSNYSFHWKLKGNRALILTYLDSSMDIFNFSHLQRVYRGKSWVHSVFVKIQVLPNALNGICKTMRTTCGQNFSSIWRWLLKLLHHYPPENWPNWVVNQKNVLFLQGKVENNRNKKTETWHTEIIEEWFHYRLCKNFG